eukprot:TRINITY_DN67047_c9_g1_i1.p1 TRINITY_DN67047_c9_g1~~TRINITY_DN67047_c9_g1_i1.p1  ORF type:complete len:453 (+),score=68.76 TRINITY_DN67047_c9_g1_i1:29-1360(+)
MMAKVHDSYGDPRYHHEPMNPQTPQYNNYHHSHHHGGYHQQHRNQYNHHPHHPPHGSHHKNNGYNNNHHGGPPNHGGGYHTPHSHNRPRHTDHHTGPKWKGPQKKEYEDDPHRLAQRQKQIMYGENTSGYHNFIKLLEKDQSLLKGCLPVKPSINQKCSKRSWDGQVRKWRRALHMYDFVDFGESEEQSQLVREALIEQNKNPLFSPSPKKTLVVEGEEIELAITSPAGKMNPPAHGIVAIPPNLNLSAMPRVRYTFEDMLKLSNSALIAEHITLPDNLGWLDKRVDLEDEEEDLDASPSGSSVMGSPYSSRYSAVGSPVRPLATLFTPKTDRVKRNDEFAFTPPRTGSKSATTSPSTGVHHARQNPEPKTLEWVFTESSDQHLDIPQPMKMLLGLGGEDKENCLSYANRAPPATPPPRLWASGKLQFPPPLTPEPVGTRTVF